MLSPAKLKESINIAADAVGVIIGDEDVIHQYSSQRQNEQIEFILSQVQSAVDKYVKMQSRYMAMHHRQISGGRK